MKNFIAVSMALMFAMNICAAKKSEVTPLQFNPDNGVKASLTMTDGKVVNYTAYTKLFQHNRPCRIVMEVCPDNLHTFFN